MKLTRRTFDSKFKSQVAIEAIREHETLNELSSKYGISLIMISRWKKEFLENASAAFETQKTGDIAMEKERDRYLRKIGDRDTRKRLISPENKISILTQCRILGISKTSHYYTPKGENEENLEIMKEINAVFPRKTLSKMGKTIYLNKYLLRNMEITHRNQVWCIDITYTNGKRIPLHDSYH